MGHSHDHHHHGHAHGHHHHRHAPLNVLEEPLDPANKSLADALRASFWVLKLVMVAVVLFFLGSGIKNVDETEVQVRWRLGRHHAVLEPGLHFSFPYPVDELIKVPTQPQALEVDAFWLNIKEADKGKNLAELSARSTKLDPALEGALITGDRMIMHILLDVEYRIVEPKKFVDNVRIHETHDEETTRDERSMLQSILQNALIAEAGRTRADVIWRRPSRVADAVRRRAQDQIDALELGITLDKVSAPESHYPLQVKQGFLGVEQAQARMNDSIQKANKDREETLKSAAGPAWEPLNAKIQSLDLLEPGAKWDDTMGEIRELLTTQAQGESGRRVRLAESMANAIVDEAISREAMFNALLAEYQRSPDLVWQRQIQNMLRTLFDEIGVNKWLMPAGEKLIYLNVDPAQLKQREREMLKRKSERKR